MPLDPLIQALNAQAAAAPQQPRTVEGTREAYMLLTALSGEPDVVAAVENRMIPGPQGGIPVRIYRPATDRPLPATMYFHGGGFVIGSLETHDHVCRALAAGSGTTVIAVDYRLAPEHPFPAAVEDCWAATSWVAANASDLGVDAARLAVAGDSAGGNLAAVVALRARDGGGPLVRFQLLIYPALTYEELPSKTDPETQTVLLDVDLMRFFWENYVPEGVDPAQAELSPLLAEDLSGLPPTFVVTAAHDPLRDEGEAYANRLGEAGVAVEYRRYESMPHAFFHLGGALPAARQALGDAAEALAKALA